MNLIYEIKIHPELSHEGLIRFLEEKLKRGDK